MRHCPACGAEIGENARYCPQCGTEIPEEDSGSLKDYWAERLEQNDQDDWTRDVDDEDLQDLNEDPSRMGPAVEEVMPPPKKKLPWIIGILCLMLAVSAVVLGGILRHGEETKAIPGSGMYYGCTSSYMDVTVQNGDDWVELRPDGTVRMQIMDAVLEGQWRLEGEVFSAYLRQRDVKGRLQDGVLSFNYMDMHFVFALPDRMAEILKPEPVPTVTIPQEENTYDCWAKDYYGSMILSDGTGIFEGNSGDIYGVCGKIRMEEKDTGRLSLWSEHNKPGDRFCIADVIFTQGTTDAGKLYVEWGKFNQMELGPGEWVVDPGKSPVAHLDQMLYFKGTYMETSDPGNTYVYEIFLKPWGESWSDAETYYEDPWMLPPQYYDWYLPLIHAGKRMPEHF